MLSDSICYGRRKKLKEKGFEDCFFKEANSVGSKSQAEGQWLWIWRTKQMPRALGMSDFSWLCFAMCWYLFYFRSWRNTLQLVCNWEFGYLAMQWREEASADKKYLMIFLQVLKQLVTVSAQLQSSGATLEGLV